MFYNWDKFSLPDFKAKSKFLDSKQSCLKYISSAEISQPKKHLFWGESGKSHHIQATFSFINIPKKGLFGIGFPSSAIICWNKKTENFKTVIATECSHQIGKGVNLKIYTASATATK